MNDKGKIMKKRYMMIVAAIATATTMTAQSPMDAYKLSQYDMKGTARFMSMGGAFTALGGDLSCLSQNPAGIGVYRSHDAGFTLNLDCQSSESKYQGVSQSDSRTRFLMNNIGFVSAWRLKSKAIPNVNIGFSYNKAASFNRHYRGIIPQLKTSLSNYTAGIANNYELTETDVASGDYYDPYNPGPGNRYVPWLPIIGYDSYLIDPEGDPESPTWQGQFGKGTAGMGSYEVWESGSVDEYNIAFGMNIANIVNVGANFDIVSVNYDISTVWQENLSGAYVYNPNFGRVGVQDAAWNMNNSYNMNGTGFKFSIGAIVKPIQELRIGLAFHTPIYYNLRENYYADQVNFRYNFAENPKSDREYYSGNDSAITNDGVPTDDRVDLQTPLKVMVGIAGVIGQKGILSVDYEYSKFSSMKFRNPHNYGYYDNYWWDDYYYGDYMFDGMSRGATRENTRADIGSPIDIANNSIRTLFRDSHTIRVGGEYRALSCLSVRAGYCFSTSPIKSEVRSGRDEVPTVGTLSSYRLDNNQNYVTCGLGFHMKGFYVDAAYVWKHMSSTYSPFAPDNSSSQSIAETYMNPKVTFNNSQVVLTAGYRF